MSTSASKKPKFKTSMGWSCRKAEAYSYRIAIIANAIAVNDDHTKVKRNVTINEKIATKPKWNKRKYYAIRSNGNTMTCVLRSLSANKTGALISKSSK